MDDPTKDNVHAFPIRPRKQEFDYRGKHIVVIYDVQNTTWKWAVENRSHHVEEAKSFKDAITKAKAYVDKTVDKD